MLILYLAGPMVPLKRFTVATVALAFLALTLVPAPGVTDAQGSGDFTTLLQPGLNMVGWTHPETGVNALFADVPQVEAIYAWDAKDQRFIAAYRDPAVGAFQHPGDPHSGYGAVARRHRL